MTIFLVIMLIIGNLYLISGDIFNDSAGNGMSWILMMFAIGLIILDVYLIAKSVPKIREIQLLAAKNNRIGYIICLVILLICATFCIFNGNFFDGLSNNAIAWFFVCTVIVMDFYLIIKVVSIVREIHRIAAENNRIAKVTRRVEALISKYTLTSLNVIRTAKSLKINPDLINKEVVFKVNTYREKRAAIYERYTFIANEIRRILDCTGCSLIDDKYAFIISNEDKLKQLKEEGKNCLTHLASYKIELLHDNCDDLYDVSQAFHCLLNSKKCQSESLPINEFITQDKPRDLMLFKYKNEPIRLFWEQYYFCLFSNVILVFDNEGDFATAIDPSALKIAIKRKTASVTVRNGIAEENQYIADDSKCISQGTTRFTWLHTCRDGSPDLRYSYNPSIEYRTDKYEYVIVEFAIADKKVVFSASSGAVGDAFKKVISNYLRKCNDLHEPIPEFLMLVKMIGDKDNTQIESIIQTCNARTDANDYFCKLVSY
ncbi:MAG: hypothetical protein E7192_01980 [Erysipelotrichaceae bacterium]|nr:hypothetical protein [Erysipelotrichaceae bacterium]